MRKPLSPWLRLIHSQRKARVRQPCHRRPPQLAAIELRAAGRHDRYATADRTATRSQSAAPAQGPARNAVPRWKGHRSRTVTTLLRVSLPPARLPAPERMRARGLTVTRERYLDQPGSGVHEWRRRTRRSVLAAGSRTNGRPAPGSRRPLPDVA